MSDRDAFWMDQALSLAEQALYITTPNPRVGCVLVSPLGQSIGQGHTQAVGQAHAEVMALQQGWGHLRGAGVSTLDGRRTLQPLGGLHQAQLGQLALPPAQMVLVLGHSPTHHHGQQSQDQQGFHQAQTSQLKREVVAARMASQVQRLGADWAGLPLGMLMCLESMGGAGIHFHGSTSCQLSQRPTVGVSLAACHQACNTMGPVRGEAWAKAVMRHKGVVCEVSALAKASNQ